MSPQFLEHLDPDCTGAWQLVGTRTRARIVRCPVCCVVYRERDDVCAAALAENAKGEWLRHLTESGRALMEGK